MLNLCSTRIYLYLFKLASCCSSYEIRIRCIIHMTEREFPVNIFVGDRIDFDENGYIKRGQFSCAATIIVEHKLSYNELVDRICEVVYVDRKYFDFKIMLASDCGSIKATPIKNDASLRVLYYLARTRPDFWPDLFVEMNAIPHVQCMEIPYCPVAPTIFRLLFRALRHRWHLIKSHTEQLVLFPLPPS